jgi:manganese oxidase
MWGIFRVPAARVPDLQPLPTNPAPPAAKSNKEWPALKPGDPIRSNGPLLDPCPKTAMKRSYDVSLVKQKIVYNSAGDNDPDGVAYVLDSELDKSGAPKAGTNVKPLFIRANVGDCLSITLTNRLPQAGVTVGEGDPINPVEKVGDDGTTSVSNLDNGKVVSVQPAWPAGNRASLHASGLVRHEVTSSDGAAVGYNYDSTVKPGSKYTYRYYIDNANLGVVNLADYGNIRGTRHHGAWGGLVVEPRGSTYLNPKDLSPLAAGEQAVVKYVDASGATRSRREFVVDIQDGLNLFDKSGQRIEDQIQPDEPGAVVDPEDEGEVGVNYRNEPFVNRLRNGGDIADVFSSTVFGDPATPVFEAYPNDPVMVRILNSQDLPRAHTFGISGHSWRYEPNDPNSNIINGQGGLNTGRAFNAGICAGSNTPLVSTAGKDTCASDGTAGDFLYNDRNFFHMLSGGTWGLIRVHAGAQPDLAQLPGK